MSRKLWMGDKSTECQRGHRGSEYRRGGKSIECRRGHRSTEYRRGDKSIECRRGHRSTDRMGHGSTKCRMEVAEHQCAVVSESAEEWAEEWAEGLAEDTCRRGWESSSSSCSRSRCVDNALHEGLVATPLK